MASRASTAGPTTRRIVDLDAGTTLPRAVSIGATILAAAALVAALLTEQPADPTPAHATMPQVAPQSIILPASRLGWGDFPHGPTQAWPIGPSALIEAPLSAANSVVGQ